LPQRVTRQIAQDYGQIISRNIVRSVRRGGSGKNKRLFRQLDGSRDIFRAMTVRKRTLSPARDVTQAPRRWDRLLSIRRESENPPSSFHRGSWVMSSWTFVDFAYVDSEAPGGTSEFDVDRTRTQIEAIVHARGLHPAVARDICDLLAKGRADFKLSSYAVIDVFSKLALGFPNVSFAIRGRGEDIRDIWVREYSQGRSTFVFGPPEGAGI
jgi:hypothetical protein